MPPSTALPPTRLTILADSDYYSFPSSLTSYSSNIPRTFTNFAQPLFSIPKTGLGSSAALVTALTAALLAFHLSHSHSFPSSSSNSTLRTLHNLAQAAHSAAQGKVGSGFDVASAVYGACVYRRFSPALLEATGEAGAPGFAARLVALVDETEPHTRWDTDVRRDAVRIPPGLRLAMCDVAGGSATPGMVRQLLAWRAAQPAEAAALWREIQTLDDALAAELVRLAQCGGGGGGNDNHAPLARIIADLRTRIRRMSAASGVPIEPPSQTALLDAAAAAVHGVVGGLVPGAGGYDALAFLVKDDEEAVRALGEFVAGWDGAQEEGKDGRERERERGRGRVRLLDVRESMQGVRVEETGDERYVGWV